MWMRSQAHVSQMMIVLMIGILSPVIYSDDSSYPAEDPPSGKSFQQHDIQQQQQQQFHDIQQDPAKTLPKNPRQNSQPLRLEVVAILSDASNESLGLSKALGRALNSITSAQLSQLNELIQNSFPSSWQSSPSWSSSELTSSTNNPHRNVTWRVRNFVISNYTLQQKSSSSSSSSILPQSSNNSKLNPRQSSKSNLFFSNGTLSTTAASYGKSDGSGGRGRNRGSKITSKPPVVLNVTENPKEEGEEPEGSFFSPNTMPILCDFLGRTKAVAIVNLIGDVGTERLLSLVSTSSALPLIGSAQYANPLQTLHKDQDDFYINLSTSVRHFARALGHMLIYCHWHSFAVLFDDSPSILSSQIIWEEELSQMKLGDPSLQDYSSGASSASNYTDYDYEHPMGQGMNTIFENGDGDGLDDPILNPNFVTLRTKSSNAAFRALSELTKATQGVIVLLCSQRSLIQVFRAAQQLRMLNGDYVFILVGQYSQFEVIPDWIPSGVLALRSPRSAQISKHTMKTTGKLLASALISVKNNRVSEEALEEPPRPTPARPYASFAYPTNQDLEGQRGRGESFLEKKGKLKPMNGPAESAPPTSPHSFPPWKNPRRNFIQPSSTSSRLLNEDHFPHQQHLNGGVFSGFGSTSDFMTASMKSSPTQGNSNDRSSLHSMSMSDGPSEHFKVNSTSNTPPNHQPSLQNHQERYNRSRKSLISDQLPTKSLEAPSADQPPNAQLRLAPLTKPTSKSYSDHHNNQKLTITPAHEQTSNDPIQNDEPFKSPPELVYTSATVIRPSRNRQNSPASMENQRQVPGVGNAKSSSSSVSGSKSILDLLDNPPNISCWKEPPPAARKIVSVAVTREMRSQMEVLASSAAMPGFAFDILNLVRRGKNSREWKKVGNASVETSEVHLETIRWPGGGIFGPGERPSKAYRVVTITAPPFVMEAEAEDNRTCVKGFPCLKVNTNNKDELALIFADFDRGKPGAYQLACCDGLAIDLLSSVGRELKFEIDLYLVPDGYFGSRGVSGQWNGIMSALMTGGAHMSFAPISVTSLRASAVDFSTPYFFSGVGLLGMSRDRDVPLLAFLAPFSAQLWAAIFIALNMTAVVVALYEWFSPFGLNPWGRQRTKNFSIASALWVVWGRLFSHLVAFKAPKSWPNKFLINVWGGFSVIFVASYTANIAALFAGMFFEQAVDVHDRSLLTQRVAAIKHSATDFYIKRENAHLWEHIQRFPVHSFQQGVDMLKNGSLDLLIGDRPLLDYYRGTDDGCSLIDVSEHDKIGDDTYAVAMARGFPLRTRNYCMREGFFSSLSILLDMYGKESLESDLINLMQETISSLVAKYIANGYMDYLQGKWYGQMACFRSPRSQVQGARALGVDAVAGMFIMLGVGMGVGLLILVLELLVYKYALPFFRSQPRGTLWRSPNLMFFSQKLYRFINCVELVSPHHAAKELVNTLRHGQITSLFQKSVKRKEHEQRRRRKSKAQFFEMIQEIRRVQRHDRQQITQPAPKISKERGSDDEDEPPIYSIQARLESNKQTPKVIRILGEHVEFQDQQLQLPTTQSQDHLGCEDLQGSSRKTSRSSIFSSRRNSHSLSGSRVSLSRSPADGPSPAMGKGFRFGRGKSEKHVKTKSNNKTITMSSSIVKSSEKKPLKTILKRGSCPNTSNFPSGDFSPSSSMIAIGKKLASASSPTPSLTKLTKSMNNKKRLASESGPMGKDVNFSSPDDSNDEMSDISAQERAEILTINLTSLSKSEVIDLWKSSETELKSQLAQALKVQEELLEKLRVLTQDQSTQLDKEKKSSAQLKHEEFQPP